MPHVGACVDVMLLRRLGKGLLVFLVEGGDGRNALLNFLNAFDQKLHLCFGCTGRVKRFHWGEILQLVGIRVSAIK